MPEASKVKPGSAEDYAGWFMASTALTNSVNDALSQGFSWYPGAVELMVDFRTFVLTMRRVSFNDSRGANVGKLHVKLALNPAWKYFDRPTNATSLELHIRMVKDPKLDYKGVFSEHEVDYKIDGFDFNKKFTVGMTMPTYYKAP